MDETVSLTSQVLTMTDAQWVAMEPSRLDGMVAELMASPKADFWGARIWMRLNHPSMRKAEPLTQAAFSVARARICVLTSQETARVWLGQAQECAENVSLDDVFDIAGLRQQIDEPPQVVDGRFTPDPCRVSAFQRECWVPCPKCGGPAAETNRTVRCTKCLYRAEYYGNSCAWEESKGPWFSLPLLLSTSMSLGEVWAYNFRHLAQLHCYVAATLRDERHGGNASWSSRLPAWMKAANNREAVLKALDRLADTAAASGLAK